MMFRALAAALLSLLVLLVSCGDAHTARGPEIEVEVERLTASKAKAPKDIQPYDAAIAWHEYRVKNVISGKLDSQVIRVAHWTVVQAKPVKVSEKVGEVTTLKIIPFDQQKEMNDVAASDDLDITAEEPPRFMDVSQQFTTETTPDALRYDYRGNVSDQMRMYWKVRGQLRAVAMGNSHATKGVNPRAIMPIENWKIPVMLNMAPAGSNNEQQCLMLREYVLNLPKLEWLFWVVSARNFNVERKDGRKYEEFTSSPGWLYDQKHKAEFWPMPVHPPVVTADDILKDWKGGLDIWGSLIIAKTLLPPSLDEQHTVIQQQCSTTNFTWSEDIFKEFCETARLFSQKGVKVLLFTTPMHPFTKECVAADPDWTTHEAYRDMVRRMEEFDKATPGLWFRDYHKDGHHDFPPDQFYDVDHLNRSGTGHLGDLLKVWMKECEAETEAGGADAQ